MQEHEWTRLVEQLQKGYCTPFLGAGASAETMPVGKGLSRRWAEQYDYPFPDRTNLPAVTHYATIHEMDPVTVKERMTAQLAPITPPRFAPLTQPHALLARYPVSVYLTTNYDNYMTLALQQAGKSPVTRVYPWYQGADDDTLTELPDGFKPTSEEPLVYHLHGSLEQPASMVLTQEDYLEFLLKLTMQRGPDGQHAIPAPVVLAMSRKPLLFVGYSLRDWSFRTLFGGLQRSLAPVQQRRHVSIQLAPLGARHEEERRQRAETYLRRYYDELHISVHWGSARAFCTEIDKRLNGDDQR